MASSSKRRKVPAMFMQRRETEGGEEKGRKEGERKRTKVHGAFEADEDVEVRRAMELSAAEARVAAMDEDAQIRAAIAQSMLQGQEGEKSAQGAAGLSSSSPSSQLMRSPVIASPLNDEKPERLQNLLPLAQEAFDEQRRTTINRLNGSLDLVVCKAWIKSQHRTALREWMLNNLAWHRVSYVRPSTKVRIVTPRFTATFGKDDSGAPSSAYKFAPKPFPLILDRLRETLETRLGARFNAIIINYYADGKDAISYHSDDEAFLGANPTIASISLGASRDFYLRRKAPAAQDVPAPTVHEQMGTKGKVPAGGRPTEKMVLDDGDLLVMKGKTQAEWEHSIPKRTRHVGGRINMTFRRVMNVRGTNSECSVEYKMQQRQTKGQTYTLLSPRQTLSDTIVLAMVT